MLPVAQGRKDIIEVCRRLWQRGFIAAQDGNISARVGKNLILCTPSGSSKGFFGSNQLILCDLRGHKLKGPGSPTSEILIHAMIYRARADIFGIVHAHPPVATGFAVAGIRLVDPILPEVVVRLGPVPVAKYATPGSYELAHVVEGYIRSHDAILLGNHGTLTVGVDVLDAYYKMETLELLAQVVQVARQLGNVRLLPAKEVQKLSQIKMKIQMERVRKLVPPGQPTRRT